MFLFVDSLQIMDKYLKGCEVETVKVVIDENIRQLIKKNNLPPFFRRSLNFYVCNKNGKRNMYIVIDDVKGKHLPITYMVVFDAMGKVKSVEVLIYREKYGWEIKNREFLEQFEGKGPDDSLRVRNIPGATISVKSITSGVKRLMILHRYIFKP